MASLLAGGAARNREASAADLLIVAPGLWRAGLAGLLLAGWTGGAAAGGPQFGATTDLVEVYATVVDVRGTLVTGLTAADFEVSENGVAQAVSTFAAGEFPLTLAVAVDRSFSMGGEKFDAARAGAKRLVDQVRPADRLLVLGIGGRAEVLAGLDAPRAAARRAVEDMRVWGTSPIGDVVAHGIDAVRHEPGRRAVVVWSDGVERESTLERAEVLERAKQAGVLVYSVAMAPEPSPVLTSLAAVSGGRLIEARNRRSAEQAATAIADELRQQYLLGYVQPEGPPGWRDISVRVLKPGLTARARRGYVATARARPASF